MAQPNKYVPLVFAPDLDPSWNINPGILTSVSNMIPTRRGSLINYACTRNAIGATFNETSYGSPVSAAVLKKIDGTGRLFIATDKRLLEATNTTTIVDRSLGGVDYASATDFQYNLDWDYTTFGNDVIFVNKKNAPQVINAASAFANVGGGPPKASCCTTNKNFVLLGNCNDGVNDYGDQIWWSALGNDASWTPSAATQAGNYRLVDTPGNVSALVNMRDTVIAYKEDSVYVGDYQGSPLLWTWRLVTDKAGCASAHGVVVVDGIHYFMHRTGMFRFDGASVQPIGRGVVNQFFSNKIYLQNLYGTIHGAYEEYSGVILWYFSSSIDAFDTVMTRSCALVYHPSSDRFGYVKNAWGSAGVHRTPIEATLSDLAAWASGLGSERTSVFTLGSASNIASILGVNPGSASTDTLSVTTGDMGDEIQLTKLTRIKPRMLSYSGSMSDATVYSRRFESAANDAGTTFKADATNCRWDGVAAARWMNVTLPISSYGEIAGLHFVWTPAGTE